MSNQSVSVIGAGDMGTGLAIHFANHHKDVKLVDHRQKNIENAQERISRISEFLVEQSLTTRQGAEIEQNISYTVDIPSAVAEADIVLETVPEDIDLKKEVFKEVVKHTHDDVILASNTSSIPISNIAEAVPNRSSNVVGCHWWYPPYLLSPVEIVAGEKTSEQTMERISSFVESVDRDPIIVNRDIPGFIWNRIQRAVYRECLHLVEEDVASIDDINRAIRDGYAVRTAVIGPFETIDIAGVEQKLSISEMIQPTLCNDEEPSRLFHENLANGRTGINDSAGFLDYDEKPEEILRTRDEKIAAIKRALGQME